VKEEHQAHKEEKDHQTPAEKDAQKKLEAVVEDILKPQHSEKKLDVQAEHN
jgi:hypothetical protein